MREANHKQILMLIGLGAVWVVLLGWQFLNSDEPVRVPLQNTSGVSAQPRLPAKSGELHVNLDLLAAPSGQRETNFTTPRNIFSSLAVNGSSTDQTGQDVPPEQRLPTPAEERKLAAAAELL